MATPAKSRPWRLLALLTVILVSFSVWALFPGTSNSIRLGLDLQGGTQVILVPKAVSEGSEITDEQLAQTVEILRARVNGLGVAEAEVTTQGSGDGAAIVVSVPGLNQDRIVELVQQTAMLDFRPVWNIYSPIPRLAEDGTAPVASSPPVQATENSTEFQAELAALDCTDPSVTAGGTPEDPEEWLGTC